MYISPLKNIVVDEKREILNYLSENVIDKKEKILSYLYNRKYAAYASSAPAYDVISEKYSDIYPCAGFSDGKYEWTSEEVMYFDLYNLKLNDDFLRYVYEKIRE